VEGQDCVLIISDNGPGFPKEAIPRIFEKFYRVPGSKAGGTGLGLSIVQGFVVAHNGTIKVENRTDGGAEFTIKFPLQSLDQNVVKGKNE
jgi:two-component system sensor histidine kinase KdpD